MTLKATAFICVYNEADVIGDVLRHLQGQGVAAHVIDNWSEDGSAEIARGFDLAGFERFPADGPSTYYSWAPLLRRVEDLAAASCADWLMLHDADEIRRSSRAAETLAEGFTRVERDGYNAVNFQCYHFRPTDDLYCGDPERHFRHYTVDHGDCQMRQVKAWRNLGRRVDLASTGGHFADFPGVAVHPEKFVLKHYPMRTSAQAARKVLRERLGRYDPAERARSWHVQYDDVARTRRWICDSRDLTEWRDDAHARHLTNDTMSLQFTR